MKYIRTKDKIIKDKDFDSVSLYFELTGETSVAFSQVDKLLSNMNIRKADTIEELCDEFVVIGIFENQIGCCCDTFEEAKELKDYVELPQGQIIYGAIWTSKGLIYVAKMNKNGELELLWEREN